MVQFTLAYVALGIALLLLLAGVLAVRHGSSTGMLSVTQRRMVIGGLGGMLAFLIALFLWFR
jgi:hypothetical protein